MTAARTVACVAASLLVSVQSHAATTNVAIADFTFSPKNVTINRGDTVRWDYAVGAGTAPHTVTAKNGSFDSGTVSPSGSFSHTFNTAGTFTYYCAFHGTSDGDGMAGTVVVRAPEAAPSTASPTATASAQRPPPSTAAATEAPSPTASVTTAPSVPAAGTTPSVVATPTTPTTGPTVIAAAPRSTTPSRAPAIWLALIALLTVSFSLVKAAGRAGL